MLQSQSISLFPLLRVAAALALLAALPAAVLAQGKEKDPPPVDQEKIDAAVAKGSEWIRARLKEGLPPLKDHSLNEIVLYALVHAGVDRGDPDVVKLVQDIRGKPPARTYDAALRAMAFELYDPVKLRPDLAQCAEFLINNQGQTGQWGYGEPIKLPEIPKVTFTVSAKPPNYITTGPSAAAAQAQGAGKDAAAGATENKPDGASANSGQAPSVSSGQASSASSGQAGDKAVATGAAPSSKSASTQTKRRPPRLVLPRHGWGNPNDNSNTQYALLGLGACMAEGITPPPDCLQRAEEWWRTQENDDGGWGYRNKGMASTGNMTAGGVSSLSVLLGGTGRRPLRDPTVAKGLAWLAKNFRIDQNPAGKAGASDFYWIYALDRAGAMAGAEWFGDHPWYAEGVTWLLPRQKPDGSWKADVGFVDPAGANEILDTCWAILFLRRATRHIVQRRVIYTQ